MALTLGQFMTDYSCSMAVALDRFNRLFLLDGSGACSVCDKFFFFGTDTWSVCDQLLLLDGIDAASVYE